jgi:hypothetical protein
MTELTSTTNAVEPVAEAGAPTVLHGRRAAVVTAIVLATVVIAICAEAGLWFVPFVAGLAVGTVARNWRLRAVLPATVAAAAIGWVLPLAWMTLRGEPVGATARAVGALAGLSPSATLVVGVTLLVAAAQASTGLWLARAVRRALTRSPRLPEATDPGASLPPAHDVNLVGAPASEPAG